MAEQTNDQVTWWHLHRRLYNWVVHFADTPHGERALFLLSFAESSFFPVPPDVLLVPLTLGAPKKWFRFALSCSIASVIGGVLGYFIGFFLWDFIGDWLFQHAGWMGFTQANYDKISGWYKNWDFWIVFGFGFTPLPYKVCTILAGACKINFLGFVIASTVGRSARFFLVAGLFRWKGEAIRPFIEKYFNWLSLAFVVLLVGGFAVLKLLHH